jgi:5-methylcytosine-specific restriction endonuclease McrA
MAKKAPKKSYYRKKADKAMQEWGRETFSECEVCGQSMSCLHHYYPKSSAGNLRYNELNLIPLCQGCHFRHHNGDPRIQNKINEVRGKKWLNKLNGAKNKFIQYDRIGHYKSIIKKYEN